MIQLHTLKKAGKSPSQLMKTVMPSYIACCLFFYLFDVPVAAILFFLDIIFLFSIFSYYRSYAKVYAKALPFFIGAGGALFSVRAGIQGHSLRYPTFTENILLVILILLFAMLRLWSNYSRHNAQGKMQAVEPPKTPFKEQIHDLERLLPYICDLPILGIHAPWGNGKSFLWEHLKENPKIKETFEIIQIDLLAVDLDNIELILIDELENLLEKSHIYPGSSHRLKTLLEGNQWLRWLGKLLGSVDKGIAASFDSLKSDLALMTKKVLINFEDIDRISDPQKIKEIFAIAETISSDRIHIVFQYNLDLIQQMSLMPQADNMSDNAVLNHEYLEKYVPFTVSLTRIQFRNMIDALWASFGMEQYPLEKEQVSLIGITYPNFYNIERILGLSSSNCHITITLPVDPLVSIRKTRAYLTELREMLATNNELNQERNAAIVAHILFIKHFYPSYFSQLKIRESPLETFSFQVQNGYQPLLSLLAEFYLPANKDNEAVRRNVNQMEKLLHTGDNGLKLALLQLMGYDFTFGSDFSEENASVSQKIIQKNDKIDHLVWNIIANGSSEWTDAENDMLQLERIVLHEPDENKWEQAWEKFQSDRYTGNFVKDNQTVARIGKGEFIDTFQAMQLTGKANTVQPYLLPIFFKLYQASKKEKSITLELLECLICCDLTRKADYFAILRYFNTLNIQGNPAAEPVYWTFFSHFMGAMVRLGYCKWLDVRQFNFPRIKPKKSAPHDKEAFTHFALQQIAILQKDLSQQKARETYPYNFNKEKKEYKDLLTFIQKNQRLLQEEKKLEPPEPEISINFRQGGAYHQKEIDRLQELRVQSPEQYDEELKKSYIDGKLYLSDLTNYLENIK